MTLEDNQELVRRWYKDVFEKQDLGLADQIFSADFVTHDPNMPGGWPSGPEGPKAIVKTFKGGLPDATYTLDDQIACNDKVVTRWTARGTHDGELLGIPPTHKRVEVTGIEIERIANGRIAETWVEYDLLGLLQQVGAIPKMAQPSTAPH
jgi:steroid delta-isomerase-like uncharacterized protein